MRADYAERAAARANGAPAKDGREEVRAGAGIDEGMAFPMRRGHGNLQEERANQQLRWIHIPANEPLLITIACDEPAGYTGHFYGGRMVPCKGKMRCSLCGQAGTQDRYVIAAHVLRDPRLSLLDYGLGLAEDIERLRDENFGELRGLQVELFRSPSGRYGVPHADWKEYELSEAFDVSSDPPQEVIEGLILRNLLVNLPERRSSRAR